MLRLRAECAWKREQTHRSLARYLLEETHETLEAIDRVEEPGGEEHLAEELGDLLLQVVFHAVLAEERGAFTLDDVARGITAKMHRRNPHVLGTPEQRAAAPTDAAAVDAVWQQIKAADRPPAPSGAAASPDDLPPTLPALLLATKTLERRARAGLPGPAVPPDDADLGHRLLALVAEALTTGTDPEQALRDTLRSL